MPCRSCGAARRSGTGGLANIAAASSGEDMPMRRYSNDIAALTDSGDATAALWAIARALEEHNRLSDRLRERGAGRAGGRFF